MEFRCFFLRSWRNRWGHFVKERIVCPCIHEYRNIFNIAVVLIKNPPPTIIWLIFGVFWVLTVTQVYKHISRRWRDECCCYRDAAPSDAMGHTAWWCGCWVDFTNGLWVAYVCGRGRYCALFGRERIKRVYTHSVKQCTMNIMASNTPSTFSTHIDTHTFIFIYMYV